MSTIYDRIRARRLELGLTAEDLAQQLGYKDKSSISKIENGKADIPQAKVELFANALHTRYELKSSGSSTGLSVAGIGSVSVPWPTDKSTLVKVSEETVADPEFYRRLFVLIENLHD